ncbi:MAG: nucleotide exchange factor GrpE [Holophagales bacterium]|jgi:molecular chaperone GrpE|nr:nucleotide exchange factor GrpE [Holophagales bacterium]
MDSTEINGSSEPIKGDENVIDLSSDTSGDASDLQTFADGIADLIDDQGNADSASELKALKSRVKELEDSLHSEENKYARLFADFQNLRNRTSKEIQLGVELAVKQILLEVLQILDSFNRCLTSTYQEVTDFRTGVGLIQKQFYDALRRLKVSEIEIQIGDTFDAHVAEALTMLDTTAYPEGSIVDICEKGFRIGDQLLRPARVVVARGNNSPENLM